MARRLCTVLVASLFLLTAACGTTDDDKADEKTKTEDSTTTTEGDDEPTASTVDDGDDGDETTTTGGGGGGADAEFCEAAKGLDTMFDDIEEGDYQGMVDAIKDADDEFETYLDALPDDLKEEGELLVDSVISLAKEVDKVKDDADVEAKVEAAYKALDTPELNEAGDAVDAYEDENCPDN